MSIFPYFNLPESSCNNAQIFKKELLALPNVTTSDIKLIEGADVQSIRLRGVIKPYTANIAEWQDEQHSFLEVFLIQVVIDNDAHEKIYQKVASFLHRCFPHHCIIVLESANGSVQHLSLASKKLNKNNANLRVIVREYMSDALNIELDAFTQALDFDKAHRLNLKEYYHYYIQVLENYNLVKTTQQFTIRNNENTQALIALQEQKIGYELAIEKLKKRLKSATQMAEKVELNTEIHALKNNINEINITINSYGKD